MAIVVGIGSFLLFFSVTVNVVALLVPYWVQTGTKLLSLAGTSRGLWGQCQCSWFYHDSDDIQNSNLPEWEQAVQWLYMCGVALMAITMLVLFIVSFCGDKAYAKAMTASGALMLIASVLVAVAVIVYGVKGNKERGYDLDGNPQFMWGMWLAVAGFALALVTAITFLIQGNRVYYS